MRRWNGRGLGRDDAKMEWQERQSLRTVGQTPTQAAVPMPVLEVIPPDMQQQMFGISQNIKV
jgi:hypothetical protein